MNIESTTDYSTFKDKNKIRYKEAVNSHNEIIDKKANHISSTDEILDKIENLLNSKNNTIIIGICGIPSSGKSTITTELNKHFNKIKEDKCFYLPLDGYHYYLNQLNEDQIKYRGRIDTFNIDKFNKNLVDLKKSVINNEVTNYHYPNFNHEQKDPVESSLILKLNPKSPQIILVEGIYIFDNLIDQQVFDLKVFLLSDIENSLDRLIKRSIEARICNDMENACIRAYDSDLNNMAYVLKNSIIDKDTLFIQYLP